MEEGKREVKIEYSQKFLKQLRKLPKYILEKSESREKVFQANPFDPRLETHKLHGQDKNHWAYSIDRKYRIKFLFLTNGDVLYLAVGTHDEVY